jgi:uncharacterized GH25 family protein
VKESHVTRSRSWIALALLAVAAIATVWALFYWRSSEPQDAQVANLDQRPAPPPPPAAIEPHRVPRYGGTFDGTVVDAEDRPVADATVLLVADGSTTGFFEVAGLEKPVEIPVIGGYATAAEVKTDKHGRFHASAGSKAWVQAIIAFHEQHAPGILAGVKEKPLKAGEGHVIRLPAAGRFRGTVIDKSTRKPVVGADVGIFVQQQVGPKGHTPFTASNQFAAYQTYVEAVLGPKLWKIPRHEEGRAGMHVLTLGDGSFEFGPVTDEVQLEFWIDHPDYVWKEHDEEIALEIDNPDPNSGTPPVKRRQRTVVPAGKTVERTFEMETGREITGRLVNETGQPIDRARVEVQNIPQYAAHHAYKDYWRRGQTGADGRFRVAGLVQGPYAVRFFHPSFEMWHVPEGVPDGARDVEFKVLSAGWLEGTVLDGPTEPSAYLADVTLDPLTAGNSRFGSKVTVRNGQFRIDKVRPGTWTVRAEHQNLVTVPKTIEVLSGQRTEVTLALTRGGFLKAAIADTGGRAVDPASVQLEVLGDEGKPGRRAGKFVSRLGKVEGEGILPGRYRAHAQALGYLESSSEPFTIEDGKTTFLEPFVMRRQSFLKVEAVVDDRGQPVGSSVGQVLIEVSENGGPARGVGTDARGAIRVAPGQVKVHAKAADGRTYEASLDVREGDTVPIRISLQ